MVTLRRSKERDYLEMVLELLLLVPRYKVGRVVEGQGPHVHFLMWVSERRVVADAL